MKTPDLGLAEKGGLDDLGSRNGTTEQLRRSVVRYTGQIGDRTIC